MWSVGNLAWLLALHRNGIVPGIVYNDNPDFNHFMNDNEWDSFFSHTNEIIIACNNQTFRQVQFHKFLMKYRPKYIEIYDSLNPNRPSGIGSMDIDYNVLENLIPKIGSKVYAKAINAVAGKTIDLKKDRVMSTLHGINVKNNTAAGSTSDQTLEESILWAKGKFDLPILASGGIGCKSEIEEAFGYGADAVLMGTLFAMAEESNLSQDAKEMLIKKQSQDLRIRKENYSNLIITGEICKDDDQNLSKNLMNRVRDGKDGIVYAGKAIDHINEIMPVKDLVDTYIKK